MQQDVHDVSSACVRWCVLTKNENIHNVSNVLDTKNRACNNYASSEQLLLFLVQVPEPESADRTPHPTQMATVELPSPPPVDERSPLPVLRVLGYSWCAVFTPLQLQEPPPLQQNAAVLTTVVLLFLVRIPKPASLWARRSWRFARCTRPWFVRAAAATLSPCGWADVV